MEKKGLLLSGEFGSILSLYVKQNYMICIFFFNLGWAGITTYRLKVRGDSNDRKNLAWHD
jgi:hypothetical protein